MNCTPESLTDDAKCIATKISPGMQLPVLISLLCQIVNNAPPVTACTGLIWGPDPTHIDSDILFNGVPGNLVTSLLLPEVVICASLDTQGSAGLASISAPKLVHLNGNLYINGCPNLAVIDFPLLAVVEGEIGTVGDPMTTLSFPSLTNQNGTPGDGFNTSHCPNLVTLDLPLLAVVPGYFDCSSCPKLTTLTITLLNQLGDYFSCAICPLLVTLSMPALTTLGASANADVGLFATNCTALTTVNMPLVILTDSFPVDFSGCALTAASVNHILARCRASGLTSSDINLSGGTSAAPTGQGLLDKAALITAGCTVTTN